MKRTIATERAAQAVGPYSQAVQATGTRMVFTAGQIGLDPETGEMVEGGVEPEFERAMRNLSAILEAAGAGLDDVVKMTVFFADLSDFVKINERYATHFRAPFPARSAVEVAALPKGARIELEAVAVLES